MANGESIEDMLASLERLGEESASLAADSGRGEQVQAEPAEVSSEDSGDLFDFGFNFGCGDAFSGDQAQNTFGDKIGIASGTKSSDEWSPEVGLESLEDTIDSGSNFDTEYSDSSFKFNDESTETERGAELGTGFSEVTGEGSGVSDSLFPSLGESEPVQEAKSSHSQGDFDPFNSLFSELEEEYEAAEVAQTTETTQSTSLQTTEATQLTGARTTEAPVDTSSESTELAEVAKQAEVAEPAELAREGESAKKAEKTEGDTGSQSDYDESDPIVTPDGLRMSEVLLAKRAGKTKLKNKKKSVELGLEELELNGKTKKDKRYTKHKAVLEAEKKRDADRISASKKFIQKNARYTEEQKLIMRTLGLEPGDFEKVMSKKSKLTPAQKAEFAAAGMQGVDRFFKGRRIRPTVADHDIIEFLAKFKFASAKILSRIRGESVNSVWRKLDRLKKGGLVMDREVIGLGTIWALTTAGMAFSGYDFAPFSIRAPKTSTFAPIIGVNHVAACLWNNNFNILMLDDFPQSNRLVEVDGEPTYIRGETLVSEQEIRSSLLKEGQPSFGQGPSQGTMYEQVAMQAKAVWNEWEVAGRPYDSPEFEFGNEYLWVLYPEDDLTVSYHVPDLVLMRERRDDGSPQSIAVEVELNQKSEARYMKTLMAYKLDDKVYDRVIWITNNASIGRKLANVAREIGLDNFDVVPMRNENGPYKNRDIWYI